MSALHLIGAAEGTRGGVGVCWWTCGWWWGRRRVGGAGRGGQLGVGIRAGLVG